MTFNIGDIVVMKETREVSPLCEIREGEVGIVKDTTCPDYYMVRFTNGIVKWVDGKFLKLKN